MKVGINGRFLCEPYTGIGQYTENLLNAMAKLRSDIEWVIVVPTVPPKSVRLPKKARLFVLSEKEKIPTTSLRKFHWEQVQVPAIFKQEEVDVAHYPYPCNPRLGRKTAKTIVTVHDIIPWVRPEYRRRLRTRLYQKNAKKALARADHIISVSETTAIALSDHIRYPYERIKIIHEDASPIFSKKRLPKPKSARPYFLYVGGYDKRKNVPKLVEAFQEYVAPKFDIDLVLVGAKNRLNKHYTDLSYLQKILKKTKIKVPQGKKHGKVIRTPSLTVKELANYYQKSLGYVNVSLAEGFNIPLLEAAHSGTPIIISDIPIHHEIVGKSGLFCNPLSSKSIGKTLLDFCQNSELQKSLRQKSATLSTRYSWEKAAKQTLELYGEPIWTA
jgi:glycosyltransferase involved in cell wall biosynthesis